MGVNGAAMMRFPAVTRRLMVALALSLFVHVLLAGFRWGTSGARPGTVNVQLQARLDTAASGQARAALSLPLRGMDAGQERAEAKAGTERIFPASPSALSRTAMPRLSVPVQHPVSRRKTPPAGPSVTESTADHRFYLARELDHFPRPLVPLIPDIAVAGSVRLWVSIDRNGKVLDAAVVAAQAHDVFAQTVRERVLATPFHPAYKDAHAVNSRVLLVLGRDG